MKRTLANTMRSGLALLMAVCLLFGMCGTALAAAVNGGDDGIINYVSFGASNVNGYGLTGYVPAGTTIQNKATANIFGYQRLPEGSYPYLVAQALNAAAGGTEDTEGYTGDAFNDPFSKVKVDQLAMSSMRVEELRFLLDETYAGDAYTDWRFYELGLDNRTSQHWFWGAGKIAAGNSNATEEEALAALRQTYKEAVENADIITVDVGINNFGVYFSNQVVSNMYTDDLNNIDPALAAKFAEAKTYVRELLAEHVGEAAVLMDSFDHMINAMAYALAGFCVNFDIVMNKLQELNPDATVVVVSIQNLMTGLEIEIPGIDQIVPMGDLFGALINTANTYAAARTAQRANCYYADVRKAGRVEFFLDQLLAYDGNPDTLDQDMKDCFDLYDNDLYLSYKIGELFKQQYGQGLAAYGYASLEAFLADGAAGTLNPALVPYYQTYLRVLRLAYDVVAEIMQAGVQDNVLSFSALGDPRTGSIEGGLLDAIEDTVMGAINALLADSTYEFELDELYPNGFFETLAAQNGLPEDLVKTIACMGIRTGIGNSFYGHPNRAGHIEIANAVLAALSGDVTGKDVLKGEAEKLLKQLQEMLQVYGPDMMDAVYTYYEEDILNLKATVEQKIEQLKAAAKETAEQLKAQAEAYAGQKKLELLAAAEKVEAALDALDAQVLEMDARIVALADELGALKEAAQAVKTKEDAKALAEALKATVEGALAEAVAGIPEAFEAVYAAGEDVADVLLSVVDDVKDILVKNQEKFQAAVAQAEEYLKANYTDDVEQLKAYAAQLAGAVWVAFGDEITAELLKLEQKEAQLKAKLEALELDIEAKIALIREKVELQKAIAEQKIELMKSEAEAAIELLKAQAEAYADGKKTELLAAAEGVEAALAALDAEMVEMDARIVALADELDVLKEAAKAVKTVEEAKALAAALEATVKTALNEAVAGIPEAFEAVYTAGEDVAAILLSVKTDAKNLWDVKYVEIAAAIADAVEFVKTNFTDDVAQLKAHAQELVDTLKAQYGVKIAAELKKLEEKINQLKDIELEEIAYLQAKLDALKADLKVKVEQFKADAEAKLEAEIEKLEAEIEKLEAQIKQQNAVVEAKIEALKAQAEIEIEKIKAAAEIEIEKLKAKAEGEIEKIVEKVELKLEGILAENGIDLETIKADAEAQWEIIKATVEAKIAQIEGEIQKQIDAFIAAYEGATTDDYTVKYDSYYVAIGDGSGMSQSYVDKLAAELGVDYKNLCKDGLLVENAGQILAANLADIQKADLITLGFSHNTFVDFTLQQVMTGGSVELDWAALVGEEGAAYVAQILAELNAYFVESGMGTDPMTGMNMADIMTMAIESYAYNCVSYAVSLPALIEAIRQVNPDAVIAVVGMNNALEGVTVKMGENELAIGEYVDYLVKASELHGLVYAMLTQNAIFVEAEEVTNGNTKTEMTLWELITAYNGTAMDPDEAGHDYIKGQILNALNVTVELLGDADGNGVVNTKDAKLIQQYYIGAITEADLDLSVSDVDGNGVVNTKDAKLVQQYYIRAIESFPVENV